MKKHLAAFILAGACGFATSIAVGGTNVQYPPAKVPDAEYPPGELADLVKLGKELVHDTNTHPLTKPYVGNALRCTSCHLQDGADPKAATFIGLATAYPAYSPREKAVITLEDRVLNCFMRSMNGTRPPLGSKPSVAITAYITSLSHGLPMSMNPAKPLGPYAVKKLAAGKDKPDAVRGKQLYAEKCAACHGANGQGVGSFSPVWGEGSYNTGAGLANVANLASWLKVAMPYGNANLSDSEAMDIAAFVNAQPRPGFDLKAHLPEAAKAGVYNSTVWDEVKPGVTERK